jgi:hypothetical protein
MLSVPRQIAYDERLADLDAVIAKAVTNAAEMI